MFYKCKTNHPKQHISENITPIAASTGLWTAVQGEPEKRNRGAYQGSETRIKEQTRNRIARSQKWRTAYYSSIYQEYCEMQTKLIWKNQQYIHNYFWTKGNLRKGQFKYVGTLWRILLPIVHWFIFWKLFNKYKQFVLTVARLFEVNLKDCRNENEVPYFM